jgi:hypothetical protein
LPTPARDSIRFRGPASSISKDSRFFPEQPEGLASGSNGLPLVWTNAVAIGTFAGLDPRQPFKRESAPIGETNFRIRSLLSLEESMSRRLLMIAGMFLFFISASPAQTPSPDAMTAARSLVTTMKLPDQYKALLPAILMGLRPALVQDRPEIERDYDAMMPMIVEAFTPYYTAMADDVAAIYANNFTVGEMREMEAFYRQPLGQKVLEKSQLIAQQSLQVSQDASRKAAEDLRARLTEALRQKGHKL